MAELIARDLKLVQYLNEAYGKERELETALQAHIALTTRASYKKRLQQHLRETKQHARALEQRVKRLGGTPETVPLPGPEPVSKSAGAVVELGTRALAAAKGPLHALRGTGEQEKMLKNAKTEYADEHEEIATYTAIETLAQAIGDRETATLARRIRREEESMARFLQRLIPALTRAVTQAEIPAAQRRPTGAKRTVRRRSGGRAGSVASRQSGRSTSRPRRRTAGAASRG
jgi:ferritin-like metal-binding protein YciE